MKCFEKALKIAEELGEKTGVCICIGNMGLLYSSQGDYEKAMKCFEKAIDGHRSTGFKYGLTYWLAGKSECLYNYGKYEESKKYADECVSLSEEISKPDTLFSGRILCAKIEFKTNEGEDQRIKNGIKPLERMLKETEEEDDTAELNYELAIMNFELQRLETADKHRIEAIALYRKMYKKTPQIDFKKKIEELEQLFG